MTETQRMLDAAAALSQKLRDKGISHAFHGGIIPAILSTTPSPHASDISCIVEGGQSASHPFRRVRDAIAGSETLIPIHSTWTNRLHVRYHQTIPPVEIEVLPAGEFGPRSLNSTTCMRVSGLPFLSVSEFVRAKLKIWMISALEKDSLDICFVMANYWDRVDINRIPEHDMNQFVSRNPAAAQGWESVRRKYRMRS